MNNSDSTSAGDPAAVALVLLALGVETISRHLLAPAIALLLTLAGWQPSRATRPPAPPTPPATAPPAASAPPVASVPRCEASAPQQARSTAPAVQSATGAHRAQLEALPVRELRQLARAAGHRSLARSGRRQQLLEALA